MKILFLTRRAWPEIGGVEKHVLEISKRLVEMGNEVTVVSEDDGSFIRSHLADHSTMVGLQGDSFKTTQGETFGTVKTHRIPVRKNGKLKKFRIWAWLWQHRDLIEEAEIIHAHDVGFWYWPFRFFYPKKPFFITFHGWEEKFPVPFWNKIQRKISEKMARGNICVGEYLQKWYGTRADYVTYGGIDPGSSFGRNDPGSLLPLKIVFIGRVEKEMGVMTYLRVFRDFRRFREFENYELIIVGEGKLRREIENYVRENNLKVKILGEVRDLGVLGELRWKARFVFASGYLSILEAMAAKKLVFSVYDNPLKEDYLRLGPLGKLVVICGNEKELLEKMKFYLENPQKEKERIDVAYNWVKGETWEKVVETYLELWEKFRLSPRF